MAVGTIMPLPRFTGLDANADPVPGGQLWTYIAGTSTPVATYTDVGLTVPHANPIRLNSAGRPASGGSELGVYLTPGSSYKFVLQDAGGATIWTQDQVAAVPTSSQTVDVIGTAGQVLPAGSAVYLSHGAGGLTAGQWYLTDADFPDASSLATLTGIVLASVPLAAQGTIRTAGAVAIPGASFVPGSIYYASAAAGALTATVPTNARSIGQAVDPTTLILGGATTFAATPVTVTGAGLAQLLLTDSTQPTDKKTWAITNFSQQLALQAYSDAGASLQNVLLLDRSGWAKVATDVYEKGRTVPLGHWIDIPFSASNFGATGGTWTVTAPQVIRQSYALVGKTLHYQLLIDASTVAGTPTSLNVVMPFTLVAGQTGLFYYANSGAGIGTYQQGTADTFLRLFKDPFSATFVAASTYIRAAFTIQIV